MDPPAYYTGESAFLTDDHLRVLLRIEKSLETPESLRQNPENLEELYNEWKDSWSFRYETVHEGVPTLLDLEKPRRNPTPNAENAEDCSTRNMEVAPICQDPEYVPYAQLIAEGGRPAMPFGLYTRIWSRSANHEWKSSIVGWKKVVDGPDYLPFCRYEGDDSLFEWQWRRWQLFRTWQYTNRNVRHEMLPSDLTVDEWTRVLERNLRPRNSLHRLVQDEDELNEDLERIVKTIGALRDEDIDVSQGGRFDEYVRAVERRLARHCFKHRPHLHANPKKQGKLATWIEYASFEYYWYDTYTEMNMTHLRTPQRFLAVWVRAQIPRVEAEEQAEAGSVSASYVKPATKSDPPTQETNAGKSDSLPCPKVFEVYDLAGVKKKLFVHSQDPTVAVRDFEPSAHEPESRNKSNAEVGSMDDSSETPKIFISDHSHPTVSPKKPSQPAKAQASDEMLKPPSCLGKRRVSPESPSPTKKQRPNTDGFSETLAFTRPLDNEPDKTPIPKAVEQLVAAPSADKGPSKAVSSPVQKLGGGPRRSPRIAAKQTSRRELVSSSSSGAQPKAKRSKSKR